MIDYYDLLGVTKDATEEEIKKTFREKVKMYHPDVNKSEDAHNIMITLNDAKEILLDPLKRERYDYDLAMEEDLKEDTHSKQENVNDEYKEYNYYPKEYDESSTYNDNNDNDIYMNPSKWHTYLYWCKNSQKNLPIKALRSIIFICLWIVLFLVQILMKILLLLTSNSTVYSILVGWAMIGIFILIINFIASNKILTNISNFITIIIGYFFPIILIILMAKWMPRLFSKIKNLESRIFYRLFS